jgi:hypothetical protein
VKPSTHLRAAVIKDVIKASSKLFVTLKFSFASANVIGSLDGSVMTEYDCTI